MSAISQLKTASHGGITFPYLDCRVRIKQRHHVHVYTHTSGGEVEKLGLALREFSFTIPAHDTLQPPFRNFYSSTLPQLWALWESGATAALVVPSVGTVQAMATEATRSIRGAMASGEPVEVQLLEDSRTLSTLAAVFTPTVDALPVQVRRVVRTAPAAVPASLLDRVLKAVSDAVSLAAQGDVMARQWEARISQVVNLCDAIGNQPVMLLPENFAALDLLLEMHLTAIQLREEARHRGRAVLLWPTRTPSRMGIAQVAAWIYGDTGRVSELMALNDFDPLNIPAGSVVRYYA